MRATILLILLLTPALSAAQSSSSQEIDEVRKNARIHFGPLYLTPSLVLKELGVDSNVFNDAGEQKSDFMFNVSPQARVWVPVARRALFGATVATDLVWYREYDTERSVDPQVTGRMELYFNRLTLFAEDAFLDTRQRTNYELDLRARHRENNLRAGASLRITSKFSVEAAALRGAIRYDPEDEFLGIRLRDSLNRNTHGMSAKMTHKYSPLTSFVVRGERFTDDFPFSPERDSTSLRVMPGVEFKPRALISGSAYAGFRRFTPSDKAALPDFAGFVAEASLSYTLMGATTFGVNAARDVHYSFEPLQPYYVSNSAGAAVRRALGRKFDLIVSADRHRYDYRDLRIELPNASSAAPEPRVDTTWNYTGSLGYLFDRASRIGFGVSYWQRESTTVTFRDYDRLRIGTSVTYGF